MYFRPLEKYFDQLSERYQMNAHQWFNVASDVPMERAEHCICEIQVWMIVSDIKDNKKKQGQELFYYTENEYKRASIAFWNSETPRHLAFNDLRVISNIQILC